MRCRSFLNFFSIVLFLTLGCSESTESESFENEKVEVSFRFKGEVDSISQIPISSRSVDNNGESKSWYAIQVYDESGYYAYGFFDNLEDMKLLCVKGNTYNFTVDMVPQGEEKVYKFSCVQQGWTSVEITS